jgi:hypothetical protein
VHPFAQFVEHSSRRIDHARPPRTAMFRLVCAGRWIVGQLLGEPLAMRTLGEVLGRFRFFSRGKLVGQQRAKSIGWQAGGGQHVV